jgi:Domain of unknown function (DUF4252)
MKKALLLLAAALPAFAQQTFDFTSLDKLGAKAKESNNITLEGDTLKLARGLLTSEYASIKSAVDNLKAIYVRNFEFDKEGQYSESDLEPLRAYVKSLRWSKIVDVKEDKETSEIYVKPLPNNRLGGLAIINAEPREVNVIYIIGDLSRSDLARLGGNMGIPDMKFLHDEKKSDKKSGDKR